MGRWSWIAAILVAMVATGGIASAQSEFPTKPVHIFVPYAPGGGVDVLARTLGDVVSRRAINDLLGGQIPLSFNNGPESVGQLQAGTVRALAVTTATRAPFLPDVPSIGETVPGYDTEVWWGLLGPGGMPRDLVEKIAHDFVAALNTDAVKDRLSSLGASSIGSSPQAFDKKIHADYEKWGPIIEAAGIRAE